MGEICVVEHRCERMQEVNGELPNYDKVEIKKDAELGIWEVVGQMGNERMEFPADFCPFCAKPLADID
ncbi:hypothetical protein CN495_07625 [Bacillus thuringiensis]|uniref:Uncharacterized protein n=1 Tax=Bacillus thuringiensis TaxID=1428 RepID=A0ABD6S9I9_BACTU|nr:hypothetical protein CN495_07625 [Bacillus thuringiensis]